MPVGSAVPRIETTATVCVITPADGRYGNQTYSGSGNTVLAALEAAFGRHAKAVVVCDPAGSIDRALEGAKQKAGQYVVIPQIVHWEDRATEWSGKRDKVEIAIKILRTADGSFVAGTTITGKSSWFTFGGDHPQDLVRAPIDKYVSSLFGRRS